MQLAGVTDIEKIQSDKAAEVTLEIPLFCFSNRSRRSSAKFGYNLRINISIWFVSHSHKSNPDIMIDRYIIIH